MIKKMIPAFVFSIIVCIVLFAQDAITVLAENDNAGAGTEQPASKPEAAGNIKAEVPAKNSSGETVKVTRDIPEDLCPVGSIQVYGGTGDPTGWLICDGRALNREEYPGLFGVIGYFFTPAGSTTFNIPDLRDRFVSGTLQNESPGQTGGNNLLTLTSGQMPVHSHNAGSSTAGNHSHGYRDKHWYENKSASGTSTAANNTITDEGRTTDPAGGHSHSIQISNTGGGQPFDNRPLFIKLNFIIKY